MKTICLIGGNTLGHVIPGVSVGRMIRKKYPMVRVIYITSFKQKDLKILKESNFDLIDFIQIDSLNKINELKMYFRIKKYFQNLYKKYKVDLVIGFGSFISSIGVLTAQNEKIDTIIHEQNKVLGLGNKLSLLRCKKLLLNYDLKIKSKKKVVVGNPILVKNKNIPKKDKLVITSGSGGSKTFNNVMISFLNLYHGNLDITLITGKMYYEDVRKKINESKNIKVVPFIDNLSEYLQDVKYIITRAGATTLSEVFELNILPIIIPSPNVVKNHQYLNALEYQNHSIIIQESDLTVDKIMKALDDIKKIKYLPKLSNQDPTERFIEVINDVKRLY